MARQRLLTLAVGAALLGALTVSPAPAEATFAGRDGVVVFVHGGNLYTAQMTGDFYSQTQLTRDGATVGARWSADGSQLAFSTYDGKVGVLSADGRHRRLLVRDGQASEATWSPPLRGGTELVYVHTPSSGRGDLWTVPVSGGAGRRITYDGGRACGDYGPSWSPDGRQLTYLRVERDSRGRCNDPNGRNTTSLVLRDVRTGRQVVLPQYDPDHDGRYFYYGTPQFTADGTGLVVLEWTDAVDEALRYDFSSGTYTSIGSGYAGTGTDYFEQEVVPTPAGSKASVIGYYTGTENGGYTLGGCLETTAGKHCIDVHGIYWSAIDVRPVS